MKSFLKRHLEDAPWYCIGCKALAVYAYTKDAVDNFFNVEVEVN